MFRENRDTLKPENSNSDLPKYSLIRNKFRTQCIKRKGLFMTFFLNTIKHMFCVHKRNVSQRRFFYAHKNCLTGNNDNNKKKMGVGVKILMSASL